MKKLIFICSLMGLVGLTGVAQNHILRAETVGNVSAAKSNQAEIKFDTLRINLGTFSESNSVQKCTFKFTNVGDAPLVINQAFASCGCTVPTFTKTPIKPGEKGQVDVTYDGKGKFPGHFQKTITIRSNAVNEIVRLTIEGTMTAAKK